MKGLDVKLVDYYGLLEEDQENVPDNGNGKEEANYLVVMYPSGDTVIYSDAMEPEDASFIRDLFWIKGALEKAYREGQQSVNARYKQ